VSSSHITKEQREVLQALRTWATEVSNNEWHQRNDSHPRLVPARPASDPMNWTNMLEKVLIRAHSEGGEDLALIFENAAWKARRKAWVAHEKGTPDCLECATHANIKLQNAISHFRSAP